MEHVRASAQLRPQCLPRPHSAVDGGKRKREPPHVRAIRGIFHAKQQPPLRFRRVLQCDRVVGLSATMVSEASLPDTIART